MEPARSTIGDVSLSPGTIGTNTNLLRVEASLAAGTTSGTYDVHAFLNSSDVMTTAFYGSFNGNGQPVPVPGMTYQDGTVSIGVPEPSAFVLIAVGLLAIFWWRRKRNS